MSSFFNKLGNIHEVVIFVTISKKFIKKKKSKFN